MPGDSIIVYGAAWCGDCRRAKRVLDSQGVNYEWVDIDAVPEAVAAVEKLNGGMRSVPTILFPDGSVLVEPSDRDLKAKLEKVAR